MYSMLLVPILFFSGAVACWIYSRELAALIMAFGFVPTILSVSQIWWPLIEFVEQADGKQVPSESYMAMAEVLGTLTTYGSVISGLAFLVLIWKFKSYAKPGP